jgi:hypothetical protein
MNRANSFSILHIHLITLFKSLRWVVTASKLFKRASMSMTSLLLKGRGKWARVLNTHVVEAVLTHQLLLVALVAKVTVPGPSKHINRITTTMIMKTYPWTLLRALSLGRAYLLVR